VASEPAPAAVTYAAPPHSAETWRESTHANELWADAPQAPAIAIVDSGIDSTRTDVFGNRIVASVNFASLSPGTTADGQGHGTMVAGVAAGNSDTYPGVARNAPIVNLRVAGPNGESIVSDVIAAADWILQNKAQYNIRVANFSLRGTSLTSFRFDPLNAALRRLWLNDVVVVAAAGNHGVENTEVSMSYAPGNDPMIISVGATDEQDSADPLDNTVAPWSGYGYTMDGFFKPDVSAPGRYLVMPVPGDSTIAKDFPNRHVAPGYMWMSGTSFASPIVAGFAAQILARYPDYSPDDVKGALMLGANFLGNSGFAAGVGQVDGWYSASLGLPAGLLNPNESFYSYVDPVTGEALEFIKTDELTGERYFDEASWSSHVQTDASWSSASWSSASWSSASWSSASWSSASWSSASWSSSVSQIMNTAVSASESTDKQ
jgi:serine protease AprX